MDKMGTPDPADCNGENGNGATSNKHPETPKNFSLPSASSDNNPETPKNFSLPSDPQPEGKYMGIRKNYKRAANRGRKGSQVLAGRNYSLRSPHSSGRVLHSISAEKKSSRESVRTLRQPASKRDGKGRTTEKNPDNEFSKIRKRVRYILNRMNYEQSLLEAYASEGWKNQSLEKIRPEKELERAKAEIVRCKLRIREAFQNLDSLLSKGKLEESLFDCEGEISCEDIFCATCGLKDSTLNNDIILCDGACDRGFHQNCLNPPLLTEDIPAGDEGWLCPACDCKIDCIDVINELHGTNLSISDSWENVFPEAAASAHGSMQNDEPDLPSDDSEDNDFDPNVAEEHHAGHDESSEEDGDDGSSEEAGDEGSDSDDSNFVTSSENSEHLKEKEKGDDLGLPSEDSEDDDYDPAGPDSDKDAPKKHSSLDESDFTSDSDDFCTEIAKSCGQDEVSSGYKTGDASNDLEGTTVRANTGNSSFASKELEIDQAVVLPVSAKRQVQRLDYKKLHDEAYGDTSSDSSDSEEWSGKSSPEQDNGEQNGIDKSERKSSKGTGVLHQSNELTPPKALQCLHPDAHHGSVSGQHSTELASNGSKSTASKGPFGPIVYKRLLEHFGEDQYPSRTVKESLAEELGMTSRQVSRWFETRRRYTRISASKKGMQATDPEEMMEKPNLCNNNFANDEVMSGNLNEGIKQGNPMEQGMDDVQKMLPTPLVTTSGKVGCPKDGSSRHAASPKDNSAEDQILGLRIAEEPRKKATQQEQKKRKMGR